MMVSPYVNAIRLIVFMLVAKASGFNHWLVTEDGKIQYQVASPFNLKQPFNLVAFLQQEDRVTLLHDLKDELIGYKEELEGWGTLEEFEVTFKRGDPACRKAAPLSSFDLYVSTVLPLEHKGVPINQLLDTSNLKSPGEPVCTSSPLDFTMYGFEHLEGVQKRRSLVSPPETSVLASGNSRVEVFASAVHHALEKNATSWILLELATLYWRARGNPYQAIECIRRALHYTPDYARDIPLLNLANILHRSGHTEQAIGPLLAAIGISPNVTIVHFMLGNVFAALGQLNNSLTSFQRCLELTPDVDTVLALYSSVQCQLKLETAFAEHSERLDATRKKLHEFYENLKTLRLSRVTGLNEEVEDDLEGLLEKLNQFDLKRREERTHQDPSEGVRGRLPLERYREEEGEGLSMPNKSKSSGQHERNSSTEEVRVEDDGVENFTIQSDAPTAHLKVINVSGRSGQTMTDPSTLEQPTSMERHDTSRSKVILDRSKVILEEALEDAVINLSHDPLEEVRGASNVCSDHSCQMPAKKNTPPRIILRVIDPPQNEVKDTPSSSQEELDIYGAQETTPTNLPLELQNDRGTFDSGEASQPEGNTQPPDPSVSSRTPPTKPHRYSEAYRSMEFLPYQPLPSVLEDLMFPHRTNPLQPIDDPFWPTKTECLDLIGSEQNWPQFTGIFLTPEARGVSLQALFSAVARDVPAILLQKLPRCTDIVELPFSMSAMDHLEGVANRTFLKGGEGAGERGLMQVLRVAVSSALGVELSFEESAGRVYAAMMKHGPHWALFNLASLYWRVSGDPHNTIECLRRAIHFAPTEAKDVGYIGLASILHRYGYLSDAVVVARAALDVTGGTSVGHYLLASIYLTLGDLLATSLHLRMALHIQPQFEHAFSTLRLIRCSLKFKEEQKYLQQKQRELLQSQGEDTSSQDGSSLDPPLGSVFTVPNGGTPEPLVSTPFTGESAIHYLTRLALIQRSKEQLKLVDNNGPLDIENRPLGTENGPLGTENRPLGTENGPLGTENGPLGTENGPLGTQNGLLGTENGPLGTENGPLGTENGPLGTENGPLGAENRVVKPSESVGMQKETLNDATQGRQRIRSKEKKSKKKKDGALPVSPKDILKDTPTTSDATQRPKAEQTAANSPPVSVPPSDPPVRHGPKTREEAVEERRKKQFPGQRPWPTLEDCTQDPPPRHILFTSTWLSVSAKGANVKEYVDLKSDIGNVTKLPYCDMNFEKSKKTLDYLAGMESPALIEYKAERGLQEVLCKIDGTYRTLDDMATRIHKALTMNSTSWVVTNLAALYWRVVGQGTPAIQCLKNALHHGPDNMRDVAFVSLANVLYRSGYEQDAAVVMQLSLEASPTLVVNHFTMANVLAAQGYLREAAGFYESTLHYQPEFEPAAERLRIARCLILISKAQSERTSNHGNGTNTTNSTITSRDPLQP